RPHRRKAGKKVSKPITRAEISTKLDTDYADMDSDKDGKVTAAEIDARLVKSAEAKIAEIKKDGAITVEEFRAPTLANFNKIDANKDGIVSVAEANAPEKTAAAPAKPAKK